MKAILDTHTFLWWNANDSQLSELVRKIITDSQNQLFLSAASSWEIAIKTGRGRLTLPESPEAYIPSRMSLHRIQALPIQVSHSLRVFSLPNFHNDPFDRMLVAQSQMEGIPIISKDSSIAQYNVEIIW
jgi:PIN domain nuclease of toxin-antitoxin system